MDKASLSMDEATAARSGLMRLHEAVRLKEPGRPEAEFSPEELLARFRAADPTRNGSCLPWLLRTYAAGGYRLEDLSKAYDTLQAFARLRGSLPNTDTIDGETRNPRKLGSHMTLASLWKSVAPLVEQDRLAENTQSEDENIKERVLAQSRVLHRSERMVVAVPMTEEASCWWGQGTQWCTAARNNNAFETYHRKAPLIVICLRKNGDLPARKLQLYVHSKDFQFMDENDAPVSMDIILERWEELEPLIHWVVGSNGLALYCVPKHLRTAAMCLIAVGMDGGALGYVPEPLRTEAICLAAVTQHGGALYCVPKHLRTAAICMAAVRQNGRALGYVSEPLRTEAMCLIAVRQHGGALASVPEHLRTEAMCLAAVTYDGWALGHVPEPLRTEAMCLAAVGSNGLALQHVPEPLRTEAMCLAAVTQYGWTLQHVPEPLHTEAMCLAAVCSNGLALQHVPEPLRTEAMCLAAVGSNGLALQHVPEPLKVKIRRIIETERLSQKPSSITSEIEFLESHDLVLDELENCINKSFSVSSTHGVLH